MLKIEVNWLEPPIDAFKVSLEDNTLAELQISLNGKLLASELVLPVYHIAEWLTLNWWHIAYEVNSNRIDYSFRHDLSYVCNGFMLPAVHFQAFDGAVRVSYNHMSDYHFTYRFLDESQSATLAVEKLFEIFTGLLEKVDARLRGFGVSDSIFQNAWKILLELTEAQKNYSIACAKLGKQPELIVDGYEQRMAKAIDLFGVNEAFELFDGIANPEKLPRSYDFINTNESYQPLLMPFNLQDFQSNYHEELGQEWRPWKKGYLLAEFFRDELNINQDVNLEPKEVSREIGIQINTAQGTLPEDIFGLASAMKGNKLRLYHYEPEQNRDSLKFLEARTLSSVLLNGESCHHFLTDSKRHSQQIGRAFAAELIVPVEKLFAQLPEDQEEFTTTQISEIAASLDVSSLTVGWHAYNHGLYSQMHTSF